MLLIRNMAFVGRISQFNLQFFLNSRFSQVQCVYTLVSCRNLCTQGDEVTNLKIKNAHNSQTEEAQFSATKTIFEDEGLDVMDHVTVLDRYRMDEVLRDKFFYSRSFSIYDVVCSQFDFGPMGCAIKSNILSVWRNFFILEEQMLEIECPILTPKTVLRNSGHVDRFTDLVVKDVITGECFRLDHLIKLSLHKKITDKSTPKNVREECENAYMKLDGLTKRQKSQILKKYDIKAPITGNDLSEPIDYCLLLETQIGPTPVVKGYLRPETSHGAYTNFKKLLSINEGKFPFAVAQIGKVFRNGTPPREFTLAEIEHFCDPDDKSHPKFQDVANTPMLLYSASNQMDGKSHQQMTIGEAVRLGIVSSETLGYFMAKTHLFLLKLGLKLNGVRFRQYLTDELPHSACECWDAQCLTSYGWVECVVCADRSVYDLTQHSKASGTRLVAKRRLPEPKTITVKEIVFSDVLIAQTFKAYAHTVINSLNLLSDEEVLEVEKQLEEKGSYDLIINFKAYNLTKDMIRVLSYGKEVEMEEFTPGVIESSFGMGRIMYTLYEQSFRIRESNEKRSVKELITYFALPALVAPIKCSLASLDGLAALNPEYSVFMKQLSTELTKLEISHKVEYFMAPLVIGKKLAKSDKIGIPYSVLVDFDTSEASPKVTIRDRDSMNQVIVPVDEIPGVISDLSKGKMSWSQVEAKYPKFDPSKS